MSEWKPGDVAVCVDDGEVVLKADGNKRWFHPGYSATQVIPAEAVRPLLVIDPEDADAMQQLAQAIYDHRGYTGPALAAALRSLLAPPKREVLEHYPSPTSALDKAAIGTASSLCGKSWRPGEDVTVVGRCPICIELVESGWTA